MNKWMKKWMKEIMNKKKKDWFVWIVDLILSKKLKGKHEKKMVLPSCGFETI